jgi:hypothetical protein
MTAQLGLFLSRALCALVPPGRVLRPDLRRRGPLKHAKDVLYAHGFDGELPEQMMFSPALFCSDELRLAARRFDPAAADFGELGRRHQRVGRDQAGPAGPVGCVPPLIGHDRCDGQ